MVKETRHVLKFTDIAGLLSFYENRMSFEREDYDPKAQYLSRTRKHKHEDYNRIKEMEEHPYDREAVLKYIAQVRNSGGFDVDVRIPSWLHTGFVYFFPVPSPNSRDFVFKLAQLAIDEINVDMKSESFELVEVVKAVTTKACYGLVYLTLAVKKVGEEATITIQAIVSSPWIGHGSRELRQWRIKPDAEPPAVVVEP
ncbi:uncharacterized protein LOC121765379 [Salvia splendens]|uniref:uncharacterized protein LOC121765379 n=1 Tax=Salvia splendens TaxID=180675 RepID=UPI001C270DC5|nr:uncharacterized protein LOC121765379 [Salvia splendens]